MTLGMFVQIGLVWLGVALVGGVFYAVLRSQCSIAYHDGFKDGYKEGNEDAWADSCRLRVVK